MRLDASIKKVRALFRRYDIRYDIRRRKCYAGYSGTCFPWKSLVRLRVTPDWNQSDLFSCALHEICHILAYREGKYVEYHSYCPDGGNLSRARALRLRYTSLRAERYVDRRAERMMKSMFPGIRFEKAYRTDTDVRYLKRGYPEIFGKAT